MKAKKIVSEKNEQLNPLPTPPTPSNEERKDELAPWQKEIVVLAEARLSVNEEQDLIPQMLRRALGLCRIVEDLALSASESETSLNALQKVMEVVQEDLQIVKWITTGRPLDSRWD
jgi:cell division protein FtsN